MHKNVRKIHLSRETLLPLESGRLEKAAGGVTTTRWGPQCISSIPCNTAASPLEV
jgi:hypothetical protein